MVAAQFPDGAEITLNQAYFRSLPDAPPESVIQRQPEPEVTTIPVHESNEPIVERRIAKYRGRRNVKKQKRLIKEDD